jgi:hypothetical protein
MTLDSGAILLKRIPLKGKEDRMKLIGWGLIALSGGSWLYMAIEWVIQTLNGYYVGGESTTALIILGMATVVLLIPFGIGVWMVRRDHHRTPSIPTS